MDLTFWIVAPAVLAGFFLIKRLTFVGVDAAREMLKEGAEIVDVRTESEFRSGHLPGAINIPLNELRSNIARFIPDKNTPLLLHCVSGGRSAIGKRMLRAQGYRRAYNLGSYSRASRIVLQKSVP